MWKLKTDDDGNIVLQDGKPVYVKPDGTEFVADVPEMYQTLIRDGQSNAQLRKDLAEAQEQVKTFEGLDPEAARKALETVAGLDEGKLADADKLRQEVTEAVSANFNKQLKTLKEEKESLAGALNREMIGGRFARSQFINEKLIIPPDIAEATFGRHFAIEGDKVVAKDANGNPIYSANNPGQLADFDEALETLIAQYPHKDRIMAGANQSGSGGAGQDGSGSKTISRERFRSLGPDEQAKIAQEINAGNMTLADA